MKNFDSDELDGKNQNMPKNDQNCWDVEFVSEVTFRIFKRSQQRKYVLKWLKYQ